MYKFDPNIDNFSLCIWRFNLKKVQTTPIVHNSPRPNQLVIFPAILELYYAYVLEKDD